MGAVACVSTVSEELLSNREPHLGRTNLAYSVSVANPSLPQMGRH